MKNPMTKEERVSEIRITYNHLLSVMDDLWRTSERLADIGCAQQAIRIDTVRGKLYDIVLQLTDKAIELDKH